MLLAYPTKVQTEQACNDQGEGWGMETWHVECASATELLWAYGIGQGWARLGEHEGSLGVLCKARASTVLIILFWINSLATVHVVYLHNRSGKQFGKYRGFAFTFLQKVPGELGHVSKQHMEGRTRAKHHLHWHGDRAKAAQQVQLKSHPTHNPFSILPKLGTWDWDHTTMAT